MKIGDKVVKIAANHIGHKANPPILGYTPARSQTQVGQIYVIDKLILHNGFLAFAFVGGITAFSNDTGEECGLCSCLYRNLDEMRETAKNAKGQGSEVLSVQGILDDYQTKFVEDLRHLP